jgi:endoglucanase
MPDPSWSDDLKEMKDILSVDLVKEMKIGWNLGNTMDATGNNTIASEMAWGNPFTTKELIDAVKAAGFNTLRIPTTWEQHLGPEPDYKIDPMWLKRVREIVDYGMANDMYVILNAHHDEWYMPTYANKDRALDMIQKVWQQIADHFQNYDEHLIFEGMNEPRMKGTSFEWNGGNAEGWDMINQLDAKFVETVRNSGGNNPLRILMIPPYAATSSTNAWNSFTIPDDKKIIVSIHSYSPYNFALNKNGTDKWSSANASDTRDIDNLMSSINNKFLKNGIPVILGEFGAMNKNGNIAAREDWATYYVKKAKENGIPCFWWDNGAFEGSGELFGLIDRNAKTWKYPEIVDALMKGIQ